MFIFYLCFLLDSLFKVGVLVIAQRGFVFVLPTHWKRLFQEPWGILGNRREL